MEDIQLFLVFVLQVLPLLYAFFLLIENIAPTPKIEAVRSRNCAMRYKTESCISPGGGVMKPAMPKPTAAFGYSVHVAKNMVYFMSFEIIRMIITFAL